MLKQYPGLCSLKTSNISSPPDCGNQKCLLRYKTAPVKTHCCNIILFVVCLLVGRGLHVLFFFFSLAIFFSLILYLVKGQGNFHCDSVILPPLVFLSLNSKYFGGKSDHCQGQCSSWLLGWLWESWPTSLSSPESQSIAWVCRDMVFLSPLCLSLWYIFRNWSRRKAAVEHADCLPRTTTLHSEQGLAQEVWELGF